MNSIRRFTTTLLAAIALLSSTGSTRAVEIFVTALDSSNFSVFPFIQLTYENDSWSFTPLSTPVTFLSDINSSIVWSETSGADEVFFGIDSNNALVTFSTSGTTNDIGGGGTLTYYGLAIDTTSADLYGTHSESTESTFGSINTVNGSYTPSGSDLGVTLDGSLGRLAYLDGAYYMTNGSDSNAVFGTVNPGNGVFTATGSPSENFANLLLTSDGTTLYGLYSAEESGTIDVYTIDTATGARTQLGSTITIPNLFGIYGAAMVVVPEPSTYVLGGLATLAIALMGKRGIRRS